MTSRELTQAGKLADTKTTAALVEMRNAIVVEPSHQMPPGSFFRFTPKARRKLAVIDWAITVQMQERLRKQGKLHTSGYSGRQTKRR